MAFRFLIRVDGDWCGPTRATGAAAVTRTMEDRSRIDGALRTNMHKPSDLTLLPALIFAMQTVVELQSSNSAVD